jgi:glycerol-3-phosphate acyltransferase PlsY
MRTAISDASMFWRKDSTQWPRIATAQCVGIVFNVWVHFRGGLGVKSAESEHEGICSDCGV